MVTLKICDRCKTQHTPNAEEISGVRPVIIQFADEAEDYLTPKEQRTDTSRYFIDMCEPCFIALKKELLP